MTLQQNPIPKPAPGHLPGTPRLHMGQTMAECDCDSAACRDAGVCFAAEGIRGPVRQPPAPPPMRVIRKGWFRNTETLVPAEELRRPPVRPVECAPDWPAFLGLLCFCVLAWAGISTLLLWLLLT